MKRKLCSLAAIVLVSAFAKAQITFTDATNLLENQTLSSGVAMAVTDMNNDKLDDIIRIDNGVNLQIEYQQPDGSFERLIIGNVGNPWGMSIADVDENGFNDIIVGGAYDGVRFLAASDDGTSFSLETLGGPNIFVQNTNFADINNDGAIDFFACHDDGVSSPYRNNGAGDFVYDLSMINAVSAGDSDNSGNYGSIWTDYDSDGDLDLFISKCRLQAAGNPDDPRRLNVLYQNDGSNNFTEVAEEAGLRPRRQTWSTNFEDIDNDGDFDAVMVNHDLSSQIYENNGDGTFTDITASSGVASELNSLGLGIQVMMEDFNNDTFIDIILTSTNQNHLLLLNDGDNTFTSVSNPFATSNDEIQSAAVGDLNNDGFIDVIAGYATGFNNSSNVDDQLFINDGNDNNWTKIHLEGVESNVNGIGARVEIQGAWGSQIREVRAGESYGTQNSLTSHFGLGAATNIATIIVNWPSGIVDTIENVDSNTSLTIVEGEGLLSVDNVTRIEEFTLFPNPASAQINFTLHPEAQTSTIFVYDVLGRQVLSQNTKVTGTQSIDISNLKSGVYFVSVGTTVQKFIKK
ncbi:FG-GAP-like repeat-containing protein [uncultured Dokdonia sp.]|uniref:FG-GAP-like repeat-containing protein n=1 Tax=uncultured Dokdonia sp. TaxID=575653 RepID=UPI002605FA20|nr:FG-GAP-like repeat-containing protein [uncultured Dokdonia sp.]